MKVSVAIRTYNQERFIAQAINSVLMQKVNFDYETVVADDASTDSTSEILRSFQKEQRNGFRLLLREKNLGSRKNALDMLQSCQGEYIALLDGDDYWISPDKLQKQVDFLDRHPECAICFHGFTRLEYDRGRELNVSPPGRKSIYDLEDLLELSFPFLTSLLMFRKELVGDLLASSFYHDCMFLDWILGILATRRGGLGYIDEVMGVYRAGGGVWSGLGSLQQLIVPCEFYERLRDEVTINYHGTIAVEQHKLYYRLAQAYLKRNDLANARTYVVKCAVGHRYCENASHFMIFKMLLRVYAPALFRLLKASKTSLAVAVDKMRFKFGI